LSTNCFQNRVESSSRFSKVPRLHLQGLRAPLAAYGILSPGDCRSSHVFLQPQYNEKIIDGFSHACNILGGCRMNNQYVALQINQEQRVGFFFS
jgi:hypothetical protein